MGWDTRSLRTQHARWLQGNESGIQRAMLEIAGSAVFFAQNTKAVKNRTGALKGSWHRAYTRTANSIRVALLSRLPHAFFQELGTGIYGPRQRKIVPLRARVLAWKDPDSGFWRFAKSVRGVPAKWIGKHAAFEAWSFGKNKLLREISRLTGKI